MNPDRQYDVFGTTLSRKYYHKCYREEAIKKRGYWAYYKEYFDKEYLMAWIRYVCHREPRVKVKIKR